MNIPFVQDMTIFFSEVQGCPPAHFQFLSVHQDGGQFKFPTLRQKFLRCQNLYLRGVLSVIFGGKPAPSPNHWQIIGGFYNLTLLLQLCFILGVQLLFFNQSPRRRSRSRSHSPRRSHRDHDRNRKRSRSPAHHRYVLQILIIIFWPILENKEPLLSKIL